MCACARALVCACVCVVCVWRGGADRGVVPGRVHTDHVFCTGFHPQHQRKEGEVQREGGEGK